MDQVGHWTTTYVILAHGMIAEGVKIVHANPVQITLCTSAASSTSSSASASATPTPLAEVSFHHISSLVSVPVWQVQDQNFWSPRMRLVMYFRFLNFALFLNESLYTELALERPTVHALRIIFLFFSTLPLSSFCS